MLHHEAVAGEEQEKVNVVVCRGLVSEPFGVPAISHLQVQWILKVDDIFPGEGCVISEILPVLWLDVQLLHSLNETCRLTLTVDEGDKVTYCAIVISLKKYGMSQGAR